MHSAQGTLEPALTEQVFAIVRHAVNLARNEGIGKVAVLRMRLQQAYPGREQEVDAALKFWADSHAARAGATR